MSLTESRHTVNFPSLIRQIMADRSLNQADLARELGIESSSVSLYLSGKREPDAFASLLLAGATKDPSTRAELVTAKVSTAQLALIAAAILPPGNGEEIGPDRRPAAALLNLFLATAPTSSLNSVLAIVDYFVKHPDPAP